MAPEASDTALDDAGRGETENNHSTVHRPRTESAHCTRFHPEVICSDIGWSA
jgi:hypothetical protein